MKLLKESIIVVADSGVENNENCQVWMQIISDIKALYTAYQSAHWSAKGDSYYGDHLLFQRLYEDVAEEIDKVAERAIGATGNVSIVEPHKLLSMSLNSINVLVASGETYACFFDAEKKFLQRLASSINFMRSSGTITDGIEDLLQGISSKHEEHVYLLQQRLS